MPLPLLMTATCPMAVPVEAPHAVDLRMWGVGAPVLLPLTTEKAWYGTPSGNSYATENFGVSWLSGEATLGQADAAGLALEAAWQHLIEDERWQAPTGSDRYLMWAVLNPYLGSDGATTPLPSPEFPAGMVVISLDPTLSAEALEAAAIHQLHHAIQERLRPSTGLDDDRWYREASATYVSALAIPDNADLWEVAGKYTSQSGFRYDSTQYGHDQGMYLLNVYLENQVLGPGAMHDIWYQAFQQPDVRWDQLLADVVGQSEGQLWTDFTRWAFTESLAEQPAVPPFEVLGSLTSGTVGGSRYLGAEFWVWEGIAPTGVSVSPMFFGAEHVLIGTHEIGEEITVQPGEVFGVLATVEAGPGYLLFLESPSPSVLPQPGHNPLTYEPPLRPATSETTRTRRGCAHASSWTSGWWVVLALFMRRRSRPIEVHG